MKLYLRLTRASVPVLTAVGDGDPLRRKLAFEDLVHLNKGPAPLFQAGARDDDPPEGQLLVERRRLSTGRCPRASQEADQEESEKRGANRPDMSRHEKIVRDRSRCGNGWGVSCFRKDLASDSASK